MVRFVVDEDMPRTTAKALEAKGYNAMDVRDCGLRGKSDEDIFQFAQNENAVVLTGDWGFGNILRFPIGSHSGIVIAHFPNEISTSKPWICLRRLTLKEILLLLNRERLG